MPAVFAMTVRLPVDLKERLRAAAARRNIPETAIIIAALERELADES